MIFYFLFFNSIIFFQFNFILLFFNFTYFIFFSVGIFAMELFEGATPLMELEKSEIFSTLSKMELTYPEKASSKFKSFLSVTLNRNPEKRFSVDELLEHPFIK